MTDKKRILVVDDEIKMCEALFDVLEQEGFIVTTATNGGEVRRFLTNIDFDLLLMDIRLRGEDGIKLIQEIKQTQPHMAVVIMTGYPSLDSAIEATRIGISDYLLKPISVESLKASIENALQKQQKEIEKSQLAKRLEEANQRLSKMQETLNNSLKLVSLGKIGPGLFHEVKNLLGIMNVSIYYLKKNLEAQDPKVKKHLEIIEKEIEHSNSIIMGLLNFSRPQGQSLIPQDLNQLTEEVFSLFEHELELKGIRIIKDYGLDIPLVFLEPDSIKQVLINLVLNAQEAMPGGGELRITTKKDEAFVLIKLTDTGCGIKRENLDKIFEPFFTTKDNSGGLGLGLATSCEIIKRHKGQISVESQEGKGTTFTLKLPTQKINADSLEKKEKVRKGEEP